MLRVHLIAWVNTQSTHNEIRESHNEKHTISILTQLLLAEEEWMKKIELEMIDSIGEVQGWNQSGRNQLIINGIMPNLLRSTLDQRVVNRVRERGGGVIPV